MELPSSQTADYLYYREKVITALADLPQGNLLSEAIASGYDFLHLVNPEQVADVTKIQVREGHGSQDLNDQPLNTQFQAYLETVINPQIESGLLSDRTTSGSYDDRKVRWSGAGVAFAVMAAGQHLQVFRQLDGELALVDGELAQG